MAKRVFSGRQMASNYRKSGAMRELMKNDKIKSVLNEAREQKTFYDTLKKSSGGGGTTKDEFRRALGDLYEKSGTISHKEVKEIGRAMKRELGTKRIEMPTEQKGEISKNKMPLSPNKQSPIQKSPAEPVKNVNTKSPVQNRTLLKGLNEPLYPTDTKSDLENENTSVIQLSRFKKPGEKASGLIDEILNKKAV
jgi:hypothetical protein